MPEKARRWMDMDLVAGSALVLLGAAALAGALNPSLADAVYRLWPIGLIGWGVALVLRPTAWLR